MWICKNKGPTCKMHLYFFIELAPGSNSRRLMRRFSNLLCHFCHCWPTVDRSKCGSKGGNGGNPLRGIATFWVKWWWNDWRICCSGLLDPLPWSPILWGSLVSFFCFHCSHFSIQSRSLLSPSAFFFKKLYFFLKKLFCFFKKLFNCYALVRFRKLYLWWGQPVTDLLPPYLW